MGLFKSKEEKEFERKVLIRNSINKLKNHIKLLEKNKQYWLDKAVEAKNKKWEQQYILAKNGLKIILEQEKKSSLMLSRVELSNQVKEFSLLGKDFLTSITSICKNISRISNSMDFAVATKEFELAMEKSAKDMDKMDAHLDNKPNQGLGTEASGESFSVDEEIDGMVAQFLTKDEEEWESISSTMADGAFGFSEKAKAEVIDGGSVKAEASFASGISPGAPAVEATAAPSKPEETGRITASPSHGVLQGAAMRPQTLQDYFGQPKAVKLLKEVIVSAQKRSQPLGHILLYGGPGLGKTTLANIIANEMDTKCIEINGPAIKQVSDLILIIKDIQKGDILFIDEIHRIPKIVAEAIYSALEDFRICYFEGPVNNRKNVQKELPQFTLIGATTDPGMLAKPFKARLGTQIRLYPYDIPTIKAIIVKVALKNGILFPDELSMELASRCQETPRLAINYVKRLTSKLISRDLNTVTREILDELYEDTGVDSAGLTPEQQEIIKTIIFKYDGGPVGLETLASSIGDDKETVASVYEPYILMNGYINILKQGRITTEKAYVHFGVRIPDSEQYRSLLKETQNEITDDASASDEDKLIEDEDGSENSKDV